MESKITGKEAAKRLKISGTRVLALIDAGRLRRGIRDTIRDRYETPCRCARPHSGLAEEGQMIQLAIVVLFALTLPTVAVLLWRVVGKNAGRRRAGRSDSNRKRFDKSTVPAEKGK